MKTRSILAVAAVFAFESAKPANAERKGSLGLSTGQSKWKPDLPANVLQSNEKVHRSVAITFVSPPGDKWAFVGRWGMLLNSGFNEGLGNDDGSRGGCYAGFRNRLDHDRGRWTVGRTWRFDVGATYYVTDRLAVRATGGLYFQTDAVVHDCWLAGNQKVNENRETYYAGSVGLTLNVFENDDKENKFGLDISYDYHRILGNTIGLEFVSRF